MKRALLAGFALLGLSTSGFAWLDASEQPCEARYGTAARRLSFDGKPMPGRQFYPRIARIGLPGAENGVF